jgi:hypothetical protein
MAKITAFEVGYCTHIGCMALKGAGLRVCKFPSRAWLLEAGDKRWLWDTGYASWFEQYTREGVFRLYRQLTPVYFDAEASLARQLLASGDCKGRCAFRRRGAVPSAVFQAKSR